MNLIISPYITLCLLLALNIFIGVKEDLYNMDVVEPPGIPVKTKRLSPKRKKARNGIGTQGGGGGAEHATYSAAFVNATSLPVEVTPRTQQSYLKRRYCKVDRAVQSRYKKIQILQKAMTSEKVKHIATKLTLVEKVKIKKKNC